MADYKYASVDEFPPFAPEAIEVSVGVNPELLLANRPDLNGFRIKHPNGTVYLILDGMRRHVPNPGTYANLFRDWSGIVTDIDVDEIQNGGPLSNGAILSRGIDTAPVYLISNGVKRHVVSPAAMDKYYFAWERVVVVPAIQLDSIPTGQPIS
jgi:hypothetical protein